MSTKRFANRLLSAVLGPAPLAAVQAAGAKEPAGGVLLTVAGDVANASRPAYDEKRDVFPRHHERELDRAFEFDRAALESVVVVGVRIEYEGWDRTKNLSGPRLADMLKTAGRGDGPITPLALDGFAKEMSPAAVAAHGWVASTRADGGPHDLGGKGPLWLVFDPPEHRPATADEEAM